MRNGIAWAWTVAVGLASVSAAGAVEVIGKNEASIAWEPAGGPVAGYYVVVARDGKAAAVEGMSSGTSTTLSGSTGETLVVQVAAFGADGQAGPLSAPSEPIRFMAETTSEPAPEPDPEPTTDPDEPASDPGDTAEPVDAPLLGRTVRDFDCDGSSDLVVQLDSSLYEIWFMQGGHVLDKNRLPRMRRDELVSAGDYDGAGCADLLWQDRESGALTVWHFDAGDRVGKVSLDATALPPAEQWRVGGSGDFDGDGVDDILLYSPLAAAAEVWWMGGGAVRERSRYPGLSSPWTLPGILQTAAGGLPEALWQAAPSAPLERFQPLTGALASLWTLPDGWQLLGAGDHDGDGLDEVLVARLEDSLVVQVNPDDPTGSGDFAVMLGSAPALASYAGSGDYDGDGIDDIAWNHADSGLVTIWLAGGLEEAVVDQQIPRDGFVHPLRGSYATAP